MINEVSPGNEVVQAMLMPTGEMIGFNQGSHGIKDMVSTFMPDVIMIQEHWFTPDN